MLFSCQNPNRPKSFGLLTSAGFLDPNLKLLIKSVSLIPLPLSHNLNIGVPSFQSNFIFISVASAVNELSIKSATASSIEYPRFLLNSSKDIGSGVKSSAISLLQGISIRAIFSSYRIILGHICFYKGNCKTFCSHTPDIRSFSSFQYASNS